MTDSTFKTLSPRQRQFLAEATHQYAEALAESAEGSAFIEARGFSEGIVKAYKLGYVADPLPGHENYVGRLAIPYYTETGYVNMVFRCLHLPHEAEHCRHAKYLSLPGEYRPMFNVHALAKGLDTVYVCEGELDAIMATQCGFPAVGIPGAERWEDHWSYMFDGPEQVIVICDADEKGEQLARKVKRNIHQARIKTLPAGEDVCSLVVAQGPQALRDIVES